MRWDESKSLWSISGTSKSSNNVTIDQAFGGFDALIVADALAAIPNSAGYAGLLDIEAHRAPGVGQFAAQMSNLKHEPVFTLMVSFPNDLSIEYDAAVVLGVEAPFQWIARDSSKPGRRTEENWTENWTAITTPHYARQLLQRWPLHVKGVYNPQNTAYREAIAKELCAEFIKFLDIKPSPSAERQSLIEGAVYKAQRWGRAFPVTRLSQDFLARKEEMFIACGDFCEGNQSEKTTATTPSPLESAWQSGRKAAELLASWLGR